MVSIALILADAPRGAALLWRRPWIGAVIFVALGLPWASPSCYHTEIHERDFAPEQIARHALQPGTSGIFGSRRAPIESAGGRIGVRFDRGAHRVELRFVPVPLRRATWGVSIATLLGIVAWRWRRLRRRPRADPTASTAVAPEERAMHGLDARPDRLAVALAISFAALYAAVGPGNFFSVDEVVVQEAAQAVAWRGTLDVPAMGTAQLGRAGAYYAHRGPALGFVALPFVALGNRLDDAFGSIHGGAAAGPPLGAEEHPMRWGGRLAIFTALLANACVGGVLVAVLFLAALRLAGDRRAALLLAAVAGLATPVLGESTHFFQHPLEALGLLCGFWFLGDRDAASHPNRAVRRALFGGLALGIAMLARPNAAVGAVVLWLYGIAVAWLASTDTGAAPTAAPIAPAARRARLLPRALAMTAGPAVAILLTLYFNWLQFGAVLDFGYSVPGADFALDPHRMLRFLLASIASPNRSVFLFAPLLAVAAASAPIFARRWPLESVALLATAAAYLLLYSTYGMWDGGMSYGPRFLFAPTTLLLLLALPAFTRAAHTTDAPQHAGGAARAWRASLLAAASLGFVVQALGVLVYVGVNQWAADRLGLHHDEYVFMPALASPWLHLQSLVRGEHLAPWALRALSAPGPALAWWAFLVAAMVASGWRLVVAARAPTPLDASAPVEPARLPTVAVAVVAALVALGFSLARPVRADATQHARRLASAARSAEMNGHVVMASELHSMVLSMERWSGAAPPSGANAAASVRATRDPSAPSGRQDAKVPPPSETPAARAYRVGRDAWNRGDVRAALSLWEQGAAAFPDEPSFLRNIALCRYALNDFAGAARDLRQVVARQPSDTIAKTDLAWTLLRLGNRDEARALATAVLAIAPADAFARAVLAAADTPPATAH